MRLFGETFSNRFWLILRKLGFDPAKWWQRVGHAFFASSKTEVRSKRVFLHKLRTEFAEARASERPIALLIVELRLSGLTQPESGSPRSKPVKWLIAEVLNQGVPPTGTWCRFDDLECAIWLRSMEFLAAVRIVEDIRAAMQRLMTTRSLAGAVNIGLSYVEPRLGIDDGLYGHEALIGLTNEHLKRARSTRGGLACNRPNV